MSAEKKLRKFFVCGTWKNRKRGGLVFELRLCWGSGYKVTYESKWVPDIMVGVIGEVEL